VKRPLSTNKSLTERRQQDLKHKQAKSMNRPVLQRSPSADAGTEQNLELSIGFWHQLQDVGRNAASRASVRKEIFLITKPVPYLLASKLEIYKRFLLKRRCAA
jgi:hypothetical protein